MNPNTPFNERFHKIQEKLNSIPLQHDQSKAHRIDTICGRITAVEERTQDTITSYNRKLHSLKDEIVRLQKQIEEENNAFETQFEQRVREIAAFESRITTKLEQEIALRRDGNLKLQGYLDEKVVYLKSDIQTEGKIRQEQIENITTSLENDLPKLYEMVKTEGQDREDNDNGTLRRAGDEIRRLNEGLGNQKKLREESETAIFEMLKDLVSRVKSEIEEEKKLREESQESLLGLLEDAANKIYRAAKD
ncbi:unnamed protein product [Paramecium primaurelia]|uniref:SF-assemblin n=2 Tax=Paramecium TaxID=5884 RepID=A0A8S1X5P8_9CILI|nr:unnamed protein product [Paramecium primaurelia]CAD8196537.1 unnamed protein product [Paramecium pentaurelia]